jgi:transcription termination factor Rho
VDQRPEEMNTLKNELDVEMMCSSFDESPQRHAQVADIVVENAKRLAESGKDVVLFVDSLTKLVRAYAAEQGDLAGHLPQEALTRCKRLLGAGRNLQGGGSVTLVAGMRTSDAAIDRLLALELAGLANSEIYLDFSELGIDTTRSRTHREDLLRPAEAIAQIEELRGQDVKTAGALSKSKSNEELLGVGRKK